MKNLLILLLLTGTSTAMAMEEVYTVKTCKFHLNRINQMRQDIINSDNPSQEAIDEFKEYCTYAMNDADNFGHSDGAHMIFKKYTQVQKTLKYEHGIDIDGIR